jgi:ABC-2 type transport system permease protein
MIGLLLLGAVYAAIGTFASSLTDNQVIAFIAAASTSFVFFEGFDALAGLISVAGLQDFVSYLGIKEHYNSISRGVIEFRDMTYFFGVVLLFLLLTRLKLQSRMWK